MSVVQRLARAGDRVFDRLRDRRAFAVTEAAAIDGDFGPLRGHSYALLVTFRRTGEAMPSPTWFGMDAEGTVYVKTATHAGKLKRLRHDGRALLAPSNARGRPLGAAIRASGRIMRPDEWPHAEESIAAAYGIGRRLSERVLGAEDMTAYVELTPRTPVGG